MPLIAIVGETASGKTGLAIELARRFNGEIISADSWAVYKGFDIGTAKPTAEERRLARFHLIDVAEPAAGFSAPLFQRLANEAIADIGARGKLPIIAGGTGLYMDSVLYGFGFLPAGSADQRAEFNAMSLEDLVALAEARKLDTSSIDARNKRRVIRLLENDGRLPRRKPLRPQTLLLGISLPRVDLHSRVTARVDAMLQAGLAEEAKRLAQAYGWEAEPMKGIGYREWRAYYEGSQSLERTRERIISATMGLAKRQRTWFKRNESIQWVHNTEEAVQKATIFLNKPAAVS